MATEAEFLALLDDVMDMIKRHNMSDAKGQRMFEAAMHDVGTWQITAVTEAAARTLIDSDFNTKLVCRAHKTSRRDIFLALRDRIPRSEAYAYFVANDETTLTLKKSENGRDGTSHWSRVIPWPKDVDTPYIGTFNFRFNKPHKEAFIKAFA